ncbi:MAG: FAD-dependent oxidoreductase [Dactylosporangium sp.]|nr:FAD-dependent oxidoreductase [Dactylosporangium sp.]NNJ62062.1 FAD-dependent oxidoreductase [Dactylosporangium sp.]
MRYDALVIGSGIGGMESALKLADMGYQVLVVEKEASVGGKMILLSKVFPTLDCASCISTPKMAATVHHPNITVLTHAEVTGIRRDGADRFQARILAKPRFVDTAACTGCRQCEMSCTVAVPDQFNADMVARRAAYIAFPQAVPKKAIIERAGTSPCTGECPAGIKAHGYVALVRAGRPEQAFNLVLEATPLVGSLGRACYAPCEGTCTRGELEGSVPIRRLKRFVADAHYATGQPPSVPVAESTGRRVAVVGSGPAGLTAAWQLALRGHQVKVFESAPRPGGMLRLGIPAYRLPNAVVDDDIANLTALGVEIATNTRIDNLAALRAGGFDAVLLAAGTHAPGRLRVPGEDLPGAVSALAFLRSAKLGRATTAAVAAPADVVAGTAPDGQTTMTDGVDVCGQRVAVIGGGNVAIDTARTALRLGAAEVHLVSLESREQMPAHDWEVTEALAEGIVAHPGWGVRRCRGAERVTGVALRRCTAVLDATGRFAPQFDDTDTIDLPCEVVIAAVGMAADTADFAASLPTNRNGTIAVDPGTLQTRLGYVFAAGDVVTGPSMITEAVGQGRRAAFMIDRWLSGHELDPVAFDDRLPVVDRQAVLSRQADHSRRGPLPPPAVPGHAPDDFAELEPPIAPQEVRSATARCLDCGVCSECHECVSACPADAIDLGMRAEEIDAEIGTVVLSTGFRLFAADAKPQYGYGRFANVITGMQMDRLLAPTRPYHTVLRPSDGKVPDRIAYVLCTGSRDQTVGNPLCSKICCMYSIKQNQLIMGTLPLADVAVHYIDVRTVGKGYDEFFEQAKGMGAEFVKGRVAHIDETDEGNLVLTYEDIDHGGGLATAEYDLVVLAVGVQPNPEVAALFGGLDLGLDEHYYVEEVNEDLDPGRTTIPGVYVAGAASGARDIPESILHAGAAVTQAAAHLERQRQPQRSAQQERTRVPA